MTTIPRPVVPADGEIDERTYQICLLAVTALAILLRVVFPLADPPWQIPVGVVWHDE